MCVGTFRGRPWTDKTEFLSHSLAGFERGRNTRVGLPGVFFLRAGDQARRPAAARAADAEAPASLFSTHSAALRAESTAPEISDSGPIESVFAKKTRSRGWLAVGMIFVKVPGVATNIGWPRR